MRIGRLLQGKAWYVAPRLLVAMAASAVMAFTAVVSPGSVQAQGMVRDNSNNSIIRGGALSQQEFVDKARANNPNDLQAVYSSYGLTPEEYDRFRQNAKMGVAHRNGDITVDGKVVARNAYSLGREQKPGSTVRTINGQRYHESRSQDVFASQTIPVMVLFDDQGRYEFGVLTACGNPIRGTPVTQPTTPAPQPAPRPVPAPAPQPTPVPVTPVEKPVTPSYRCESIRGVRRTSGTDLQYNFLVRASHTNARVSYVDFDFGDGTGAPGVRPPAQTVGSTTNSTTNPNAVTTYDYSTGTYTTNTGTTTTATSGTTYTGSTGSVTTGRTEISQDHDYAQHGTYRVRAVVHFAPDNGAAGGDLTDTCEIQFTTQRTPVTPVATPPAAPPVTPTLPATGVGEFVALFTAVSVLGSAGYYIYTKRRLAGL